MRVLTPKKLKKKKGLPSDQVKIFGMKTLNEIKIIYCHTCESFNIRSSLVDGIVWFTCCDCGALGGLDDGIGDPKRNIA